jgi:hypothetical protein
LELELLKPVLVYRGVKRARSTVEHGIVSHSTACVGPGRCSRSHFIDYSSDVTFF